MIDHEAVEMSEYQKAQLCREWIDYCRSLGWRATSLQALVDLFWQQEGWKTFKGYPR